MTSEERMEALLKSCEGVSCPDCGSKPSDWGDASWRWNGENWEHRCKGVHPQVGHWVVEAHHGTKEPVNDNGSRVESHGE